MAADRMAVRKRVGVGEGVKAEYVDMCECVFVKLYPQDCWGLVDRAPLARQPLLMLQYLPGRLALLQRPCHFKGEGCCDWEP